MKEQTKEQFITICATCRQTFLATDPKVDQCTKCLKEYAELVYIEE